MDFIANMKGTVKLDLRYKSFQDDLRKIIKSDAKDIFVLGAVVGYKNSSKSDSFEQGGIEFRPVYLNKEDRSILYTIAYDIYGDDFIKNIGKEDFQKEVFTELMKYCNGGMDILYSTVFKDNMTEGEFRSGYTEYDTDLMKYIYQSLTEVPF